MRAARYSLVALTALALLSGSAARAQQEEEGAAEVGLRTGFGIPFGQVSKDSPGDLSDTIDGAIPIWLDIGYRFNPDFFVGLYGQYAYALPGVCEDLPGGDCSIADIRLGLQAHYHILPMEVVDPFVGGGIGLEWLAIDFDVEGREIASTGFGVEFLNLQFGLDIGAAPHFVVGPFATVTLGEYMEASLSCSGGGCPSGDMDMDIEDKAIHGWVFLGARAAYTP